MRILYFGIMFSEKKLIIKTGLISFLVSAAIFTVIEVRDLFVIVLIFVIGIIAFFGGIRRYKGWYNLGRACLFVGIFSFWAGMIISMVSLFLINGESVKLFNNVGKRTDLEGIVAGPVEARDTYLKVILEVFKGRFGDNGWHDLTGKVVASLPRYPVYEMGDRLVVSCLLEEGGKIDDFDYSAYLRKDAIVSVCKGASVLKIDDGKGGVLSYVYRFRSVLIDKIDGLFKEPAASLVAGVLLGIRSSVPKEVTDSFNATGLSHILAVSGYNITLVINLVGGCFKRGGRRFRFFITLGFIVFFVIMTGLSASVLRAAVMGGLYLFAKFSGRKPDLLLVLLFSAVLMTIQNPQIILFDVSFQLSFLSTLGLIVFLPYVEKLMSNWPAFLQEGLAVTLAAQVFTTPIILLNYGRFSLISPLANLIMLPLLPFIMFFSAFGLLISFIWFGCSLLFSYVTWGLVFLLLKGIAILAAIPFSSVNVDWFNSYYFITYYIILAFLLFTFRKRKSETDFFQHS